MWNSKIRSDSPVTGKTASQAVRPGFSGDISSVISISGQASLSGQPYEISYLCLLQPVDGRGIGSISKRSLMWKVR